MRATKSQLTQCVRGGDKNGRSGYVIAFDYDAELIENLKKSVPHTNREWREQSKTWWVSIEYEAVLDNLFGNFDALAHLQGYMF